MGDSKITLREPRSPRSIPETAEKRSEKTPQMRWGVFFYSQFQSSPVVSTMRTLLNRGCCT